MLPTQHKHFLRSRVGHVLAAPATKQLRKGRQLARSATAAAAPAATAAAPAAADVGRQRRPGPRQQPFLVRVAGRSSDVKGAAGAIVKRLRQEDTVRVAAIDDGSILKAMIALTAANNMAQANSGQMLVFQPTLISQRAAEPPRLPEGSMVMYTSQLMQGEVMTFNTLRVTSTTEARPLARAVIARLQQNSHTVLECYGTAALVAAVKAVAEARKGLLVRGQDVACIITSTPKAAATSADAEANTAASGGSSGTAVATGDAGTAVGSGSSSRRPPLCHRLVLLECEPRNPRALLVRSTVGVSDRVPAFPQATS